MLQAIQLLLQAVAFFLQTQTFSLFLFNLPLGLQAYLAFPLELLLRAVELLLQAPLFLLHPLRLLANPRQLAAISLQPLDPPLGLQAHLALPLELLLQTVELPLQAPLFSL